MKKIILPAIFAVIPILTQAQFGGIKINTRSIEAGKKTVGAITLSDQQVADYARQAVTWMDNNNEVATANDKYTIRLNKLFGRHKNEDGLVLNYKVYKVLDINAFACADGSVRVFSSLMDMMTDDELLAVIGHEIGHVKNQDTKDAMKRHLMTGALKDAAASQSGAASILTDSQLGQLADGILAASYNRKQESQADEYGYKLLRKYSYNVKGMYTAFLKLAKLSEGGPSKNKIDKMMSSHPESNTRAQTVKDWAKRDGIKIE